MQRVLTGVILCHPFSVGAVCVCNKLFNPVATYCNASFISGTKEILKQFLPAHLREIKKKKHIVVCNLAEILL